MSSVRDVDVAIIGAGTAGLSAYSEVCKATEQVVLINGGPAGTMCARVGCMPSKALIQVANDFHHRQRFAREGIVGEEHLRVDYSRVLAYVRSLRDHFVHGVLTSMEKFGDRYIEGYARFLTPTTLDVEGQRIRAKRIIIATGSRPIVPKDWQVPDNRLLTTDSIFEQTQLPTSLAVIGLGAIGVEMGQALVRLGVDVIGFDQAQQVAGLTDPEVNICMREILSEEFPLHIGAAVTVQNEGKTLAIHREGETVHVDSILASLGRRPQVAELGLDNLGVPLNKRGLPPYDPSTLQVADLPIFITGDADGDRPILHEAADDGRIAGFNSVQDTPHCFQRRTRLGIVFSEPNVAVVGRSFAELHQHDIAIGTVRFAQQGRATVMAENKGILRVYGDKQTGCLVGAELAAPRGEHLAHLLAWAIQKEMTVFDLLQLPFYHPVVEEGLRSALRDLSQQVQTQCPSFDLALCDSAAVGEMS
jgi:dihydrolipoamide dehydrogenase